ncbi:hypothetical protein AAE478_004603 [Parahypoxylon ruwenzoriense]
MPGRWQLAQNKAAAGGERVTHSAKQTKKRPRALYIGAGLGASLIAALALLAGSDEDGGGGGGKDGTLNKTDFSPFTVTSKEAISPTAFVLSVRTCADSNSSSSAAAAAIIRAAWEHGLWSVEIKQPQLQIARHYTPLPPLSPSSPLTSDGNANANEAEQELRFLVRRVDGGEMSTYLSKLRVGDRVWLRGPHSGFDVARRLGHPQRRSVVFLAGGTGIAPALQVARRLLDGPPGGGGEEGVSSDDDDGEGKKPAVSILWANRCAADALGRPPRDPGTSGKIWWWPPSWWGGGPLTRDQTTSRTQEQETTAADSSLARQIRDLERRHPGRFRISYFVDEEGRYIGARDIRTAAAFGAAEASTKSAPQQVLPVGRLCPWHSPAALEQLRDDDDASRRGTSPCTCAHTSTNDGLSPSPSPPPPLSTAVAAGVNLLCVSGPDGFIAAYAGPKRWHGGTEMQGPVRGVLGQMLREKGGDRGDMGGNWLVLKL